MESWRYRFNKDRSDIVTMFFCFFNRQGLNTFISDVFSGIITTPGPHQLACFRDDVVFLIYLYQRRWATHRRTVHVNGIEKRENKSTLLLVIRNGLIEGLFTSVIITCNTFFVVYEAS